jgi:hypothetical protein
VKVRVEALRLEQASRKALPIRSVIDHLNPGGPRLPPGAFGVGQGEGRAAGGLVLAKCNAAHNRRII